MQKEGATYRVDRVADLVRQALANILLLQVRNPYVQGVTVTQVKMSPDLKEARVYYDWIGSADSRQDVEAALSKSSSFIRRSLAKKLAMKQVPQLHFHYDETREFQDEASRLLGNVEPDK